MELWDKITGTVTLRLTAADPERILDQLLGKGIDLWDIRRADTLNVSFRITRGALPRVRELVSRQGGEAKVVGLSGLFFLLRQWLARPLVVGTVVLLLIMTWLVPGRILFIRVQGNETLPSRLILERAGELGLGFGASRQEVRSEILKNQLLGSMGELEWVGVNTSGCVATITVREREGEPVESAKGPGELIACTDGIVDSVDLFKGTLLCKPGEAVREGQVLASDPLVQPEAEIYAITSRHVTAVLPENTLARGSSREKTRKISLIVGKKRINFFSGSGILPGTCGKMTTVKSLTMPGGWELPVKLVVEELDFWNCRTISRENPEELLKQASLRTLKERALACTILTVRQEPGQSGQRYELKCRYECREMIARFRSADDLEGDAKDDYKNGERGAG